MTLRDLLAQYRCPVVDRLEQIYKAAPSSHPQNLFLIVYFAARPNDYVQCVFDPLTHMFCEAASGFYDNVANKPRTRRLPASAIAALDRLGFSTDDSAGNFQASFDVAEPPDLNAIADLILKALHDAFDARAGVTLLFEAPLAPRPTGKCVPVSWTSRQAVGSAPSPASPCREAARRRQSSGLRRWASPCFRFV